MSHIQFWPFSFLSMKSRTANLLLSVLMLTSLAQFAKADVIPEINRQYVEAVIADYDKQCSEALGGNAQDSLRIRGDATYQMPIDEHGTTATVLITDFSCGDLGPMWCGSGGCDTFLFVDGKTFVWRVSWAPFAIQIPTYSEPRSALLFPLSGGYCKTASATPTSTMMSGCYAIVSWDSQRETFVTPVNGLKEVGVGQPYTLRDDEP